MNDVETPRRRLPEGAAKHVAHYLGAVAGAERDLREALILVAERHADNYELSHGASTLAIWSRDNIDSLRALTATYGTGTDEPGDAFRSALLIGPREGVIGELADVCDLAALAQRAEMLWTVLVQGAKELREDTLIDVASLAREHSRRQLAWLRTILEHEAPDAIALLPRAAEPLRSPSVTIA